MTTEEKAKVIVDNISGVVSKLFQSISSQENLTLLEIEERGIIGKDDMSRQFFEQIQDGEGFDSLGIKFVALSDLGTHKFSSGQLKFYVYTLMANWLSKIPTHVLLKTLIDDYKVRAKVLSHVNSASTTKTTTTVSTPGSDEAYLKRVAHMSDKKKKVNVLSLAPTRSSTQPFSKYVTTPKSDDLRFDLTTELTKIINTLSVPQKLVAYTFIKKLVD
jgi:hypothetical protein